MNIETSISERFGHKKRMCLKMDFFHILQENSTTLDILLNNEPINREQIRSLWAVTLNEIYLREILLNGTIHKKEVARINGKKSIDDFSEKYRKIMELIFNSNSSKGRISDYKFKSYLNDLGDHKITYYEYVWDHIMVDLFKQLKNLVNKCSKDKTIFFRVRNFKDQLLLEIGYKLNSERNNKLLLLKNNKKDFLLLSRVYKNVFQKKLKISVREKMFLYSFYL